MDSKFRGHMCEVMFKELEHLKRPTRPELETVVNAVVKAIALAIEDSDRRAEEGIRRYVKKRFDEHCRFDHGWL